MKYEIKIEYKNGNVFSLTADENNVRNVMACLLDECVPFGKCKNLYKYEFEEDKE